MINAPITSRWQRGSEQIEVLRISIIRATGSADFQNAGSSPFDSEVASGPAPAATPRQSAIVNGIDSKGRLMDKTMVELLARRAGLDKALAEFPEDVAAAAEQAGISVAKMKAPTHPRAEPWPPMRTGSGL
jgi:hypothetical protein